MYVEVAPALTTPNASNPVKGTTVNLSMTIHVLFINMRSMCNLTVRVRCGLVHGADENRVGVPYKLPNPYRGAVPAPP